MTAPSRRRRETHLGYRAGWLRAAVLGANDGIVSTASLVLGVAAAGGSTSAVVTAGIAGLVAGGDTELADLRLEERELTEDPEGELDELAEIYERRGLTRSLARQVAVELSTGDRLAIHARDELGLEDGMRARPLQAAWASALSFMTGAALPLLAIGLAPTGARIVACVALTAAALGILGYMGAVLGGAPRLRAAARVLAWGVIAMATTAGIGALTGAVV